MKGRTACVAMCLAERKDAMATKTFTVSKISCNHCVMTIEKALGALPGVTSASGDAAAKTVKVEWDEPPATWDAIRSALEDANYPPDEG